MIRMPRYWMLAFPVTALALVMLYGAARLGMGIWFALGVGALAGVFLAGLYVLEE